MTAGRNDEILTRWNLEKILTNRVRGIDSNPELMVESLTAKENKILQMITDGKTQKEVAIQLYMSQRTIATHMQHILNKLGVHSTVSAVVKALELGVVKIKSEKNQ